MVSIYDAMPPRRIGALIACRLRSIEIMCTNALHQPAHDYPNLGELPAAASDARFLGRDGVGAIGGGDGVVAHVRNMDAGHGDGEQAEI